MNPVRYLVVYKDGPKSARLHFGPFVSDSRAHEFKASLPEPLVGGLCSVVPLQPFGGCDATLVSDKIIAGRH